MSVFDKVLLNAKALANAAQATATATLEVAANEFRDKASIGIDKLKDTKAFQTVKEGSDRVTAQIDTLTKTDTFQSLKAGAVDLSSQVGAKVGAKFDELNTKLSPELIELRKKLAAGALSAKDSLVKTGQMIDTEVNSFIDEKTYSKYDSEGLLNLYHNNRVNLEYKLKRLALEGGLNLYTDIKSDGGIAILSRTELRGTYNVSPDEKYVLIKEDSLKFDFDVRNQVIDALLLMEEQNKISNLLVSKMNKPAVDTPSNGDSLGR